jgi:phage terminase small subunit
MKKTTDILTPERPPKGLSPAARRIWRQLNATWVFEPDQLLILWDGLRSWDRCNEAAEILKREGLVLTSATAAGVEKTTRHPAAAIEREARTGFQSAFRMLGLSIQENAAPAGRPSAGKGWKK